MPLQNSKSDGVPGGALFQTPGLKPSEKDDAPRRAEARLFHPKETALTRTGMKLGTAGYMSPEQIRGEALDARSDIFSFGLVLYEMATGERAFAGEAEAILHDAIQHREPRPVRGLAPESTPTLEELIAHCLEKEPSKRYQSVAGLSDALVRERVQLPQIAPESAQQPAPASHSRRRLTLALVTALVVIALAGVLYRRAHPPFKLTDKDTIVLADFENKTGDPVLDSSLTEALRIALEQTPYLNLLTGDKVNRVLKQIGQAEQRPLTFERAKQVCGKTNSAAVVTGSIADAGNRYEIDLRAIGCGGKTVLAESETVASERNLIITQLGRAAFVLRKKLAEPEETLRSFNQPLEIATTSSVEAFREFTEADHQRSVNGDAAAAEHFRRATEIDPSFAVAHSRLASAYYNMGARVQAGESAQKAYDLRSNATRRQRFYIEGNYFAIASGENNKALTVLEQAIREYPHDYVARSNYSRLLRIFGLYERAAVEATEAVRLAPEYYPPYYGLMQSQIVMGQYAAAKATFEDALSYGVDNDAIRDRRFYVAFLENDHRGMDEQLQWATQNLGRSGGLFSDQAEVAEYFGRMKDARRFADYTVSVARSNRLLELAGSYQSDYGLAEAEVGNTDLAKESATRALEFSSTPEVSLKSALVFARSGDTDQANKLTTVTDAEVPQSIDRRHLMPPLVRAAILLN